MNPLTLEWISKAEGDFATVGREVRARKNPNYDAACFHAQQCAEKYLKDLLQEAGVPFGRTHNLIALLEALLVLDENWEALRPKFNFLTVFSVLVRYPGESADKEAAREAVKHCVAIRDYARQALGLAD